VSGGICDNAQRPWINVDHANGTYHVNRYPTDDGGVQTDPDVTYIDNDGDGLTDRKIDWPSGKTFDAASPFSWEPFQRTSEPSGP
jgi:hypothetical protein